MVKTIKQVTSSAGLRRHLPAELHSTSSGAFYALRAPVWCAMIALRLARQKGRVQSGVLCRNRAEISGTTDSSTIKGSVWEANNTILYRGKVYPCTIRCLAGMCGLNATP